MGGNVFQILEIEPTNDKKEIKKAYAKLVKRYHPEEYPEEWKKIHDAYELALKIAQYVQPTLPKPPEPEMKESTGEQLKKKPPVLEKKPETGGEWKEQEKEKQADDTDKEQIESLFQDIGKFSKEQQKQKEEAQRKVLEKAVEALKQMAAKKRLNQKEWEAFFQKEDMLPIFSMGEFLYQLGECFTNKAIDIKLYRFLTEQLVRVEQYRKDENMAADHTGVSDPLGYARSKIYSAYKAKWTFRDLCAGATVFVKALAWLLIAALSVAGVYLRWTNPKRMREQRQEEMRDAIMQEMIESDTGQNQDMLQEMQRIAEEQKEIGEKIAQSIGTVEIGDTKEKMISIYGEPDILQEYAENPEYEEAVYHQIVFDIEFVLDNDIVIDIVYVDKSKTD